VSAKNDVARRRAETLLAVGEQRATGELARKKAADSHQSLLARIAEQRALRLAKEQSRERGCNEALKAANPFAATQRECASRNRACDPRRCTP
jgi:hypothetical protein